MINLPIQEAEAFDRISILQIKGWHGLNVHDEMCRLLDLMTDNLGKDLCRMATHSDEYQSLSKSNLEVFKLVEKAAKDECKASEVDAANQRRYAAKRALQERFWPAQPLTEVKAPRPNDLLAVSKEPTVPKSGGD